MRYKLVIFDLDGTILNTLEDLADSVNAALKKAGYPLRTVEEVRCFVGNGIRKLMERIVPAGCSTEEIDRVHRYFTEFYTVHCADKTRPYEGIESLVKQLHAEHVLTAVVSNKADYAVQSLCEQYFPGLFDYVVGEREGVRKKPCPDSVKEVLKQLKVEKEDAVYIGDSDVDIETAANAGMKCISVDWGFRDREFLLEHGAACIVSTTEELYAQL